MQRGGEVFRRRRGGERGGEVFRRRSEEEVVRRREEEVFRRCREDERRGLSRRTRRLKQDLEGPTICVKERERER